MTRRLILLRHGQTDYNATGRMQGQMDTKLSKIGVAQAENAARYLATMGINYILSSDLSRAADTARIVASVCGVPMDVDERLRETNLGEWQGQSRDEVDEKYPGARLRWRHDARWAPPGGEARLEVARRARTVINELMCTHLNWDDGAVLVVAHGGTIGSLTSDLLELSIQQHHMFSGLGNTCWAQLMARPRYNEDPDMNVIPHANGEGDPVMDVAPEPRFNAETLESAQWYLDGWNISVEPGLLSHDCQEG